MAADGDSRAVLDAIRRIVQTLRVASRAAEREVGVSAAQLFVLAKLHAAGGPLSVGELAERTLTHQSSVSVVVQKLESRGLLARVRGKDDARRVELSLTPSAKALLRKAPEAAQDRILDALTTMPAGKRRQLAELLSALANELGGGPGGSPAMLFEDAAEATGGARRRGGGGSGTSSNGGSRRGGANRMASAGRRRRGTA